ncbi:MAG: purine-cytosine permease family protein [Aestuariibacter sp.]
MTELPGDERHIIQDYQLVSWPKVASISAMVAFSLPTFITGIEIYQVMNVPNTVLAILIGSVILTLIGAAMGTIGTKTRMSSYLLVRIAFGNKGAAAVNLAFAISLIGWFGININIFSGAVTELLHALGWFCPVWIVELLAGICMVITTLYGFRAIQIISSLLVPVLVMLTAFMFWQSTQHLSLAAFWEIEKTASMDLSHGIAAIVGTIIIGAIILPDITRFSKQQRGGFHTAFWSYMVVQAVVMLVAGIAAAAMVETEILALLLALGLGGLAFIIVIAGSWVLNSLNLYSAVLSIKATFPKMRERNITLLLGSFGVIAAFLNILDFFITFLVILSAIFVPVAGVIIIDFFLFKQSHYQHQSLLNNSNFNTAALLAWAVGAGYAGISMLVNMPSLTHIEVLDSMLLTAGVYCLISKFPMSLLTKEDS